MKIKSALFMASCLALLALGIADAEAETAERKFGRGLAAMTCGFLEVPGNIVKETQERGPVGIPIGLAYGVGMLVTRELVGVYEFLSAPFPAPEGFRPILHPEYPWGYFQ